MSEPGDRVRREVGQSVVLDGRSIGSARVGAEKPARLPKLHGVGVEAHNPGKEVTRRPHRITVIEVLRIPLVELRRRDVARVSGAATVLVPALRRSLRLVARSRAASVAACSMRSAPTASSAVCSASASVRPAMSQM